MIVNRPPNRMIAERQRQEQARLDAEENGTPRPIPLVGGGHGGSLISFTAGLQAATGR